jgi:hypothetical protein
MHWTRPTNRFVNPGQASRPNALAQDRYQHEGCCGSSGVNRVACWRILVVAAVSSPRPYPHARRRFHSLSMSGGWTAPLGKMLLIRNRSKQTACRAMELVGKAANATIEPQPAICLLKSDRGHRVYTEIEDRFLPQGDSPRAMNGAPQRPQNARRSR